MTKKRWGVLLLAEMAVLSAAILWSVNHFQKNRLVFHYGQDDFQCLAGEAEEEFYVDASVNNFKDIRIGISGIEIPDGSYLVDVKYWSKGISHLEMYYEHGRNEYDLSGNILLDGLENRKKVNIMADGGEEPFCIIGRLNSECVGGDYLLFSEVTISRTFLSYRLGIFRLLLGMALTDLVLYLFSKRKEIIILPETRETIAGIATIAFIASIPLMMDGLFKQQDLIFHLNRIEGIKEGLASAKDFPVRIQPQWLNGHGYPVSIFYGDFWLYFPALLRLVGISVQDSYKVFILFVNLATAWLSYFCFSQMGGNRRAGLAGAAIYTLNLYRLTNIYVRAALGELVAMTFFPLVFWGLWHIFTQDLQKIKKDKVWILLSAGYLGVLFSHLISCEMIGMLTVLICVFRIKKIFVKERFFALLKAFLGIVAGGAWYWLPLLEYMQLDFAAGRLGEFNVYRQEERGIFWAQFFTTRYNVNGESLAVAEGMAGEMPLTLGIAFFIILMAAIYLSLCRWNEIKKKKEWAMGLFLMAFFMWICTKDFPFGWLGKKLEILQILIARLQYPWRFLSIVALLCAWIFVMVLSGANIEKRWKKTFSIIVCTVLLMNSMDFMSQVMNDIKISRIYDGGALPSFGVSGGEYLYEGYEMEDCVNEITDVGEGITVSEWERGGNEVRVTASNASAEEQTLELPVIRYEGYRARDMQTGEEFRLSDGKSHRAVLHLPGGYSGSVRVKFAEPWHWRAAELVSLASAAAAVYWIICDRRKLRAEKGCF